MKWAMIVGVLAIAGCTEQQLLTAEQARAIVNEAGFDPLKLPPEKVEMLRAYCAPLKQLAAVRDVQLADGFCALVADTVGEGVKD